MSIVQLPQKYLGQSDILPSWTPMVVTDNLATVTTAGYLNSQPLQGFTFTQGDIVNMFYSYVDAANPGTFGIFTVAINSSQVITLTEYTSGTGVNATLPTIVNHIAVFSNTIGDITENVSVAIQGGSLQAGLSGTAGYVASFPATLAKGSLRLTAVANTNDTLTTISNAAMGQASIVSIPDPGNATANFIISKVTGGQHITVGALAVDAGTVTSGISTGGQVGSFVAFPTTASKGSLALTALVNSAGDFSTTISNATSVGQSQVITIPDCSLSAATFLVNQGPSVMGSGSRIILAKGTGTESSNAVTINQQSGVITTTSLTTIGGSTEVITLTNAFVFSTSVVVAHAVNGTNSATANYSLSYVVNNSNIVFTIFNNTGATSFNGTILIHFAVF